MIIGETGSGKTSMLNAMIGEMIHLTNEELSLLGKDYGRVIKDGEMRGLEEALLASDLNGRSPVTLNGTTSYSEQQAWI